jgi:hypothetical protein
MRLPSSLRRTLAVLETLLVGLSAAGFAGAADAVLAARPVTLREVARVALVGAFIGVAALVRRSPWAHGLPEPTTPTAPTTAPGASDEHRDHPASEP